MSNFTLEIKRELLQKKLNSKEEKKAFLAALMRTSGALSYTQKGFGFVLVTESERMGERLCALVDELYGVELLTNAEEDRLSGKDKFTFLYSGEKAYDVLIDLGVFERQGRDKHYDLYYGISKRLLGGEEEKISYIRGAFLGGGSCTVPHGQTKTGYHLEFVFSIEQTAKEFLKLLFEFEVIGKIVKRKGSFVVYLTALSSICDLLAVLGLDGALTKISKLSSDREGNNNNNRKNNCFVGNMDRVATAAANQYIAIRYLMDEGDLQLMDEALQLTAKTRLEHVEASLEELASILNCSKSCVNHRMRKLMTAYQEKKNKREGEREE